MKNKLLYLLFILLPMIAVAQREPLKGRVYSGSLGVKHVLVVNQNAQAETRTDSLGNFSIKAQMGDLLIVSDYKIENRKIRFTPDLVQNGLLLLEVKMVATELNEVVIDRSVTSQSLGIPMGKKYTPAERRLRTASNFDPTVGIGMMPGVSVSFDAILNAISGRTKRLKQELKLERKEALMALVKETYSDEEFITTYSIPQDYINGFIYYAAEDVAFTSAIQSGNKLLADLSMVVLTKEYIEIINNAK